MAANKSCATVSLPQANDSPAQEAVEAVGTGAAADCGARVWDDVEQGAAPGQACWKPKAELSHDQPLNYSYKADGRMVGRPKMRASEASLSSQHCKQCLQEKLQHKAPNLAVYAKILTFC